MRTKILVACFGVLLAGTACSDKEKATAKTGGDETATLQAERSPEMKWEAPKAANVDGNKRYFATIKTNKGDIKVELFANDTPLSVTNFTGLAQRGFYRGLTFHRVVPGFVIQGGDPTGTGRGGPGYTLPAEIKRPHSQGALAWARLPDADPQGNPINPKKESSGSQFYITLASQPSLDGEYTVFGQTIEGVEVLEKIERGDKIVDVVVEVK